MKNNPHNVNIVQGGRKGLDDCAQEIDGSAQPRGLRVHMAEAETVTAMGAPVTVVAARVTGLRRVGMRQIGAAVVGFRESDPAPGSGVHMGVGMSAVADAREQKLAHEQGDDTTAGEGSYHRSLR